MRRIVFFFLLSSGAAFAAHPGGADWSASRLNVRHSAMALMPEGTPPDYEEFQPLHPTVVAWGEDALGTLDGGAEAAAALAGKFADYRRLGATALATNVWMLTATERFLRAHPNLADTSCVDLWGERIVPAWLADADDHGVKPWWGCTNQPRYQQHLMARLRAGLAAGATMIHLDDHAGTFACATGAGGCFCDRCRDGFRAWLGGHVPAEERRAAGVNTLEHFDYAAFLRKQGYANRDAFIHECWAGRVPLWNRFLAFQREAARAFIARLHAEAASVAGRRVPIGVNAYNLQPQQLFDADLVDYFANEVEHFGVEDTVPPVVYRLGEALGRPVFATGTGEDWIAYRRAKAVNRVRGWIAEAYAFGEYFMYSWNKWGFSKETGTVWTQVPTTVYQPLCDFIGAHRELFDGLENRATVGLLYDNASVQRNPAPLRAISKSLLDAGVAYRLVVNGDENLRRTATARDCAGLSALIVPSNVPATPVMRECLDSIEAAGVRIVTSSGSVGEIAPSVAIRCSPNVRVWAIARFRAAGDTAAQGTPKAVIHVLNREYDGARDRFVAHRGLEFRIPKRTVGTPVRATYFAPSREPVALEIKAAGEDVSVTVPQLDIWGIVAFE